MLTLSRDEMAFRRVYADLLEQEKLTTVFRPGRRLCTDFRGYAPGQIVKARVLKNIGADWAGIAPEFTNGALKIIKITNVEARKLGSLEQRDFEGSSPDVQDVDSLRYHLGVIYNLSLRQLSNDAIVTRIAFSYKRD